MATFGKTIEHLLSGCAPQKVRKRFFFAKILVKINRFNCVIKLYMFYWVTITYPDIWYLDVITTRFTCTFLAIYRGPFLLPG